MDWIPTTIKTCLVLGALYIAFPVIIRKNPWIFTNILYLHFLRFPFFFDLKNPEKGGIKKCRNFYIKVKDDVEIGAWHLPPYNYSEDTKEIHLNTGHPVILRLLPWQCSNEKDTKEINLNTGHPVILYFHGNAATRAQDHRVQLYKVLTASGFHVIAVDYRGFADSTGYPSEDGILEDTYSTYHWVKERLSNGSLYIWGHSLGTAISTKFVRNLNERGDHIDGLILESPFLNLLDATKKHPMSRVFRIFPWFESAIKETMKKADLSYSTDENIQYVTDPILILHAEDDHVIPVQCGRQLHQILETCRKEPSPSVMFKEFSKIHKYRHNDIYKCPHLPDIVRDFVEMCNNRE